MADEVQAKDDLRNLRGSTCGHGFLLVCMWAAQYCSLDWFCDGELLGQEGTALIGLSVVRCPTSWDVMLDGGMNSMDARPN